MCWFGVRVWLWPMLAWGSSPAVWCSSLAGVICHVLVWFVALKRLGCFWFHACTNTYIYSLVVCKIHDNRTSMIVWKKNTSGVQTSMVYLCSDDSTTEPLCLTASTTIEQHYYMKQFLDNLNLVFTSKLQLGTWVRFSLVPTLGKSVTTEPFCHIPMEHVTIAI